jgi:SPP1 gp7 family putative phage head morphogenesis protein
MSTRRAMVDATTRHQIFLQRYAGSKTKQLIAFVKKLELKAKYLMPDDATPLTKARYVKMVSAFQDYSAALKNSTVTKVMADLKSLTRYEADFTKRIIDQSANTDAVGFETVVPTPAQLDAAAFSDVMGSNIGTGIEGGLTVADALDTYGSKIAGSIIQNIRQGYATGQTNREISQSIQDLVGEAITRSQANAVARTVTNFVANAAKESFYTENDDLITGFQVVATLDSRTTLECASLDGQVFDKEDFEAPPYHWNCRTTYIGVIDPQYSVSSSDAVRPSKGSDGTEEVAASTTYNSWLREQSDEFQNEVLGKERADMFRGGASVQSFVDHNYQPYTIDELKAKDAEHT